MRILTTAAATRLTTGAKERRICCCDSGTLTSARATGDVRHRASASAVVRARGASIRWTPEFDLIFPPPRFAGEVDRALFARGTEGDYGSACNSAHTPTLTLPRQARGRRFL